MIRRGKDAVGRSKGCSGEGQGVQWEGQGVQWEGQGGHRYTYSFDMLQFLVQMICTILDLSQEFASTVSFLLACFAAITSVAESFCMIIILC